MNWRVTCLCVFSFTLIMRFATAQKVIQYQENPDTTPIMLTVDISIPRIPAGYTAVLPQKGAPKGLIVFFNADRDTTNDIFHYANQKGLAVAFVTTDNYLEFFFDNKKLLEVEYYIHQIVEQNNIPPGNLLYTGMSLAGTRALKMALFGQETTSRAHLKPRAVAICDAPLDFVRFWKEATKAKTIAFNPIAAQEGDWVSTCLELNLRGTPQQAMAKYLAFSPYSYFQENYDHLKALQGTAVRAYTEPDVQWWMETRRKDYYGMNAVDLAALINELWLLGNKEAALITTVDKGYRPDGTRHPHSWSIVDQKELVDWFLSIIQ